MKIEIYEAKNFPEDVWCAISERDKQMLIVDGLTMGTAVVRIDENHVGHRVDPREVYV